MKSVESGQIDFDGDKSINPFGGLIGCGHPVGDSGARVFFSRMGRFLELRETAKWITLRTV